MIFVLLFTLFVAFLIHQFWYRRLEFPVGPTPLPLIGNLHSLWHLNRWEDKFLEWKNTYGPIYTYWLGPIPIISINSYEKNVEVFVKNGDLFADRYTYYNYQKVLNGGGAYGVFDVNGPMWSEQRRFSIKVLKDFGVGTNRMQDKILEEIETLFENLDSDANSELDECDVFKRTDIAVGSVINLILNGFRFTVDGNEAQFYKLKKLVIEASTAFGDPLVLISLSNETFSRLPIVAQRFNHFMDLMREIFEFLGTTVDQHIDQLEGVDTTQVEARDFIEAFLIEQKRCEESGEKHFFSRLQLINLLSDLWFAGQETTSTTITWLIAYLIMNEDVQNKLHEELDRVIQSKRIITVADRQNLPYTNAVIMETQRKANIITQNFYRCATKDVEIGGCMIKKGSYVVPQISVLAIDPMNFKDPQNFDPCRFIDKNDQLKRCEVLLPFSIGKRACLGEGLAKMELFLFTANIFNRYKFSAGSKAPSLLKVAGGGGFAIEPYKCKIEKRN